MAIRCTTFPFILLHLLALLFSAHCHDTTHTYIIHVSKSHKPSIFPTHRDWYTSTLLATPTALLYTYDHTLHGFAARLTPNEASHLRSLPFIQAVHLDDVAHLDTTRSPDFLGLNDYYGIWPATNFGDDIIVGVIDTGVWPEGRRSFSDHGMTDIPARWKGSCVRTPDFNPSLLCNKKLIGAKFFPRGYEARYGPIDVRTEYRSPRDTNGHGTHCASTAAGAPVKNASFHGFATGEARGVATKARLAVYKVCWLHACMDSDILAAMDEAVSDGVDVMSLSIARRNANLDYDQDSMAIGAFGAVDKGVIVVFGAGNSGPEESTVRNIAPWMLTVGASSIDRDFRADVLLGDGRVYRGVSLYSGQKLPNQYLPLVYAGNHGGRLCAPGVLSNVTGKIVICDSGGITNLAKGNAVKQAGGAGMILASEAASVFGGPADQYVLPASTVDRTTGSRIKVYALRYEPSAIATIIFPGTVIGPNTPAPQVAEFSSRGPNGKTPEIIKPDVIAPGVNILASMTGWNNPSEFGIMSGTSMACPHVSGTTALLRKAFPTWSPAAIKSAIMTTAYTMDNACRVIVNSETGNASTPFDRGSGHIYPNEALDPGLIYDLNANDYIGFLCSIGYSESRIAVIVGPRTVNCSKMGFTNPSNLNYPSFSVVFKSRNDQITLRRVVKNVGQYNQAVYTVTASGPPSVNIVVSPNQLVFSHVNQQLSYEVKFSSLAGQMPITSPMFGSIEWSDGIHVVRSPIALTWTVGRVASI